MSEVHYVLLWRVEQSPCKSETQSEHRLQPVQVVFLKDVRPG